MATITDLVTQKRDKERVNLFLDGEFAFGLAFSVAAGLKIGQQLTAEEIDRLKSQEQIERAKKNALRYVSVRPRSVYELRTHLQRKSFEDDVINAVVEYLTGLELLDDTAFANYWIDQRETFRPRSRFALGQELRQKGIDRKVIDAVLEDVDELAAARRVVDKRADRWANLPEDAYLEKMAGFLQRRGFSYEIIREVLQDTWQDQEET
ncbi:MAG: regulatory protein RecX [Candidatus Promineifilaceae bacterium]